MTLAYNRRSRGSIARRELAGLLYLTPWAIGFLVFQLYPLVSSMAYSFTNLSVSSRPSFLGLENYRRILSLDADFWISLRVTFLYVAISVPLKLAFALFVAMLLNTEVKGIGAFRTIYYLPSILGGSVAVSILWRLLFSVDGAINKALGLLSIAPVSWLGSPRYALFTISLLSVWQFGSSMIVFLAGLKQVPNELYEAASIDGSSSAGRFFKITLPMITPMLFFNLVMQTINAFQEFTAAFVITNGGPMKSTYLYGLKLYQEGFQFFKMGYASALSWILFAILIALTALTFKSSSYWTFYEDGGR
jgi:oligogalacturonide transport system permease protein